jgi:hypothetical protein
MPEESRMPVVIPQVFYALLLMMGVGLYLGWGVLFNVWDDLGVYALSVILIGFGLVGFLLYRHIEREDAEKED